LSREDINPSLLGGNKATALHIACQHGHTPWLETFFQLRPDCVDVNSVDSSDRTPMHFAAHNGHEKAIKLFLKQKGINVNLQV